MGAGCSLVPLTAGGAQGAQTRHHAVHGADGPPGGQNASLQCSGGGFSPGDSGQCLETFLVFTTCGGRGALVLLTV